MNTTKFKEYLRVKNRISNHTHTKRKGAYNRKEKYVKKTSTENKKLLTLNSAYAKVIRYRYELFFIMISFSLIIHRIID